MLNIDPPDFKFCPFCSQQLTIRTEEGKDRKYCSHCNWTYYPHMAGSAAALVIEGGKILMVKRAREPFKNTWSLPAGFVDYGEHPSETVLRELKEETGLDGEVQELVGVIQITDDSRAKGHFGFFYKIKPRGQIILADPEENSEIAWHDLNNLPEIGWQAVKKVLEMLYNEVV